MDEIKNKKFSLDVTKLNRIFKGLNYQKITHYNKILKKNPKRKNSKIEKCHNPHSLARIKQDNPKVSKKIIKNIELDYLNFSQIDIDDYKINKSFDDDLISLSNDRNVKRKMASLRYFERTSSFTGESKVNISILKSPNYGKENNLKDSMKTPSTICNYYEQSKISSIKQHRKNSILLDNNSNEINNINEEILNESLKTKLSKEKQNTLELSRRSNIKCNKMKSKSIRKKIKNCTQLIKYKLKKNKNYKNRPLIPNKINKKNNFEIFLLKHFKNFTINDVDYYSDDKKYNENNNMIYKINKINENCAFSGVNVKKSNINFFKSNNKNKPLNLCFDKIKYDRYFNQNNSVSKKKNIHLSSKKMKIKTTNFLSSKSNFRINTNSNISESSSLFYLKNRSTVNTSKNNNNTKIIINYPINKEHNFNVHFNKNKAFKIKKIMPNKKQITPKNKIPKCNKNINFSILNKKLFVDTSDQIVTALNEGFTEMKNGLKYVISNDLSESKNKKCCAGNQINEIKQKLFQSNIYNTQNNWRKKSNINNLKKCKNNSSFGIKKINLDQFNNLASIEKSKNEGKSINI